MTSPNHSQLLATHLINQTLASISALEQLSLIPPSDAHLIRSKLPSPTGPFPSLESPAVSHSFSSLSLNPSGSQHDLHSPQSPQHFSPGPPPSAQYHSPAPPPALPPRGRQQEPRARALWDYTGTESDDLSFRAGDTIVIDEEVNDQWYRGRVMPQGQQYPLDRQGLFPSNYIERITNPEPYKSPHAPPQQMVAYQPPGPPQQYPPQGPPQGYHYGGPQYQMSAPQQGPPQQMVVQQQQHGSNGRFGKLGGKLGTAAVQGAGFGFGSAVASDLVHAIL